MGVIAQLARQYQQAEEQLVSVSHVTYYVV